ncbi:L-fucose isomerase and related proteins-like protein (fragment) [Verrucomicrobia bacterium]
MVEATLRANLPVTIARLWRCDGKYFLTAREGQTLAPKRHLMATNGLARLDTQDPRSWFEDLCHQGMPHHVAVSEGHHEALLRQLARALGIHFL